MFIEQLRSERQAFAGERRDYAEQLMSFNRRFGELDTALRQITSAERSLEM